MPEVKRSAPRTFHWQTVLFAKKDWTKEDAEKWLEEHGCIITGFHATEDYWRFRQYDPEDEVFRYFHKSIDELVVAVCGVPKENKESNVSNEQYDCECISCGHRMSTDQHCRDISCPSCGGQMRRASRPGPGQTGG